ncbi:MAG: methylmalonyl-CoA epimerase [Chloroflexota bacterium]
MTITGIDHIGVAVKSIDEVLPFYIDGLGLKLKDIEVVTEQKVRTAIIPVGDSKIELLESTDSQGPIARHIDNRGEGLHHVALKVSDIKGALKSLAERDIHLVDKEPRRGVESTSIAFLHPRAAKVLIELVESAEQ